jgi:pyruvate formate lyase activating enzyme
MKMTQDLPLIRGFIENTLIDWGGRIACEVFLPTCNLRCPFCHAGHLVTHSGELESIPVSAVTECLDRHQGWIDGVVISGGEPTLHAGLTRLIEIFREHGAQIKLDSNGTHPEVLKSLFSMKLVDAISMDVKAPLDGRYLKAAGVAELDVKAIRRSIDLIMQSGLEYEFRTTCAPGFIGLPELQDIARELDGAERYYLQEFKPIGCLDPAMNKVEPYPRETLRAWADAIRHHFKLCRVRGDGPENSFGC